MSIFKRILTSIFRKPFKSLLLLLTVFVIGSFVGASYSIYKSSKNVEADIRNSLDAYAVIQLNWDKLSQLSNEELDLAMQDVNYIYHQLKDKESVVASNVDIKTTTWSFDSIIKHPNTSIYVPFFANYVSFVGINPNENMMIADLNSQSNEYRFILTEGRNFTQEDYDQKKHYVLIQEDSTYLDDSEIKIGDLLPASYFVFDSKKLDDFNYQLSEKDIEAQLDYQFEVIGKYEVNKNYTLNQNLSDKTVPYFKDFVILSNVMEDIKKEINTLQYSIYPNANPFFYNYHNLLFKLNSIDDIPDFMNNFQSLAKKNEYVKLITTADGYLEIKGTLENMNLMAITTLIISIVASVLVGMMMIYLFLKNRKKEVGILIAMGEAKKRIVGTIVGEIVILGLVGLLLSIGGGNGFGRKISNEIFDSQLQNTQITDESLTDVNYKKEIMDKYNIDMTKEYVVLMLSGGCLVLAVASAFPIISIMRLKPKDILL